VRDTLSQWRLNSYFKLHLLAFVCFGIFITPEIEVTYSSETSVNLYQTIRRHTSVLSTVINYSHYKHDFWFAPFYFKNQGRLVRIPNSVICLIICLFILPYFLGFWDYTAVCISPVIFVSGLRYSFAVCPPYFSMRPVSYQRKSWRVFLPKAFSFKLHLLYTQKVQSGVVWSFS
jgi:hypothetical protein